MNLTEHLHKEREKLQKRIDAIDYLLEAMEEPKVIQIPGILKDPSEALQLVDQTKKVDENKVKAEDIRAYIDLVEGEFSVEVLIKEFGGEYRSKIHNTLSDYVFKGKLTKRKENHRNVYFKTIK